METTARKKIIVTLNALNTIRPEYAPVPQTKFVKNPKLAHTAKFNCNLGLIGAREYGAALALRHFAELVDPTTVPAAFEREIDGELKPIASEGTKVTFVRIFDEIFAVTTRVTRGGHLSCSVYRLDDDKWTQTHYTKQLLEEAKEHGLNTDGWHSVVTKYHLLVAMLNQRYVPVLTGDHDKTDMREYAEGGYRAQLFELAEMV